MFTKKTLIISVAASVTLHVALIAAVGLVEIKGRAEREKIMAVEITGVKKLFTPPVKHRPVERPAEPPEENQAETAAEDNTIDLGSGDPRYSPYLRTIRLKIESVWVYPRRAYEQRQEGTTAIVFTVDPRGKLTAISLAGSSGYKDLDSGTLLTVMQAAPFAPFPSELKIPQLKVTAQFRYRMTD